MKSRHSFSGTTLLTIGAALLTVALLFGATLAWHVHLAGSYHDTFVVLPGWIAWSFVGLSVVVVSAAAVLAPTSRDAQAARPRRQAMCAAMLTGAAWLIVGAAWAVLRAG
ncbi:hypothetical protein ISP17_07205 [Dyella ginsengisoli]|uniref:Transmembrane protein n=1 Tax=Dyella ginsengisoli TaxID=363848 RepID=A0ABW8JU13_9GAMM